MLHGAANKRKIQQEKKKITSSRKPSLITSLKEESLFLQRLIIVRHKMGHLTRAEFRKRQPGS